MGWDYAEDLPQQRANILMLAPEDLCYGLLCFILYTQMLIYVSICE